MKEQQVFVLFNEGKLLPQLLGVEEEHADNDV